MKKKIAILGSTGSIGDTTLKIIKKDKKNFQIILLSTNNNASKIFKQAKYFKVKNVIITNLQIYLSWKNKFAQNKINVYQNFESFRKIFVNKIDYTINAISGIDGLNPTIKIIRFTKKIAIANKESIICGWNLINNELIKYKTDFIPVDSEHFSIFKLIKDRTNNEIEKIIITASGGPFLKKKINRKVKVSDALNHPNWKMGKKISIDSSTLMNKVFEVIEAKKIFNIGLKKIDVVVNPNSYIHACIVFKDGTIEILAHENKMEIPILNSIYTSSITKKYSKNKFNLIKINNLNLCAPNKKKFVSLGLLNLVPNKDSLFETVLITINDELVHMFLNNKIEYNKILFYLMRIIKFKKLKKYCKIKPRSIKQIINTRNQAVKAVHEYVKF